MMKMLKTIALTLAAVAVLQPALAQRPSWEEFQSYEGRFRVLAPGPMEHKVDSVETPIGKLAYHTFFYQSPEADSAENYFYMLSYCDYPEGALHADSTELLDEFFDATIESAVESVRGELIYSSERDHRNNPGRIWRIDYLNGQAVIKTWAVFADNRYYALQAVTVKGRSLNRAMDRFLDSFRLLR